MNVFQSDYEKFYKDIMKYVVRGIPNDHVCHASPPPPISEKYAHKVMQDTDPSNILLTLSGQKYGDFIDCYYKLLYIAVKNENNKTDIEELKKEIAYDIRRHNDLGASDSEEKEKKSSIKDILKNIFG